MKSASRERFGPRRNTVLHCILLNITPSVLYLCPPPHCTAVRARPCRRDMRQHRMNSSATPYLLPSLFEGSQVTLGYWKASSQPDDIAPSVPRRGLPSQHFVHASPCRHCDLLDGVTGAMSTQDEGIHRASPRSAAQHLLCDAPPSAAAVSSSDITSPCDTWSLSLLGLDCVACHLVTD
jgi:hypothetical protein